jgi:hypothetical protein
MMILSPPFLARTVTAVALIRTIAPHFFILRNAFEFLEDGLDSILNERKRRRRRRRSSSTTTYSEEEEEDEEEEMTMIKKSADSIAALRAMEYRRGRKALVKDKFAKKLAGTVTNATINALVFISSSRFVPSHVSSSSRFAALRRRGADIFYSPDAFSFTLVYSADDCRL